MKPTIKNAIFILVFWAPLLLCCAPEQDFFLLSGGATWEQARQHCQVCYHELVSVTAQNIQTIVRVLNLTSDSWIGLRKHLNASSSGSALPWSRWANGDPLTFQNWYPGWPKAKPVNTTPACSCCCPSDIDTTEQPPTTDDLMTAMNSTMDSTMDWSIQTQTLIQTQTQTLTQTLNPNLTHVSNTSSNGTSDENEDADGYIEDTCVAMLSFGAWVEKDCMKLLPYICYEDRFKGSATQTNVTSSSATLTWQPGPGNISHYEVEVNGEKLPVHLRNLTYDLVGLTSGTLYSVRVFAVKCNRSLNPQTVRFYTRPGTVQNLNITMVTTTSVAMHWTVDGNASQYEIRVHGTQNLTNLSTSKDTEVRGLTPGGLFTFEVMAGVGDNSLWGEAASISAYTKPGKVSNLTVSENYPHSVMLSWNPPEGNVMEYRVTALNITNVMLSNITVNATKTTVENLPTGTKLWLSVVALVNGSVEGDNVTTTSSTAPASVSSLRLLPTSNSITASWELLESGYEYFDVEYQQSGFSKNNQTSKNTTLTINGLKAAANYTVAVYTVSGDLRSPKTVMSNFTLPVKPGEPSIRSWNASRISLEWPASENTEAARYLVSVRASFWGDHWDETVNKTSITFDNLRSGTKYDFEVRTLAGDLKSDPVSISKQTDPEEGRIVLSMLCSSVEPLLCDHQTTRDHMFEKLHDHFKGLMSTQVFWNLTVLKP
ncbi:receptor-type tyrosine-protein phosphatase eta [Myripristis murdjan]|uniref:receptor-type tyrosine-protein phosphatase eta n=1 Tax=Myripristis murdjan TaxID=586833 RepID=UPI0011763804|nr:receptor-type tyrosine-protein phosphatase eta-like [Myripristis murdjan]XP_029932407.1 receptor-type tyrosine-protein phosphatase eta-like [Myripristis murdjan]